MDDKEERESRFENSTKEGEPMNNGATKGPWGTPMIRNTLLFSTINRANHRHRGITCPSSDEQYVARKGEKGLNVCEEIIFENEREKNAGSGFPKCGCPNQNGEHWSGEYPGCCWPQIIVRNGIKDEYVMMQVTPDHYAGLIAQ